MTVITQPVQSSEWQRDIELFERHEQRRQACLRFREQISIRIAAWCIGENEPVRLALIRVQQRMDELFGAIPFFPRKDRGAPRCV